MSDQARRAVISLALLAAVAIAVIGVMAADTGPGEVSSTAGGAIEDQIPRSGDQVLSQGQVGVDLAEGWTGTLALNGTDIPEQQLTRNLGLNQVLFQPGPGKVVDALPPGTSCLTARVWEIARGPGEARTVRWCFEVL